MTALSKLSIGFIVGGALLCAAIILGFVIWKVIDHKRRRKLESSVPLSTTSRAEHGGSNAGRTELVQSRRTESVYSEVAYDNKNQSVSINEKVRDSGDDKIMASATSADDSAYSGSQADGGSGEYSKLREVHRYAENVYGEFSDADSGHGSHLQSFRNQVPEYSKVIVLDSRVQCDIEAMSLPTALTNQRDQEYSEVTPNSPSSANQQGRDYLEVTPFHQASAGQGNRSQIESLSISEVNMKYSPNETTSLEDNARDGNHQHSFETEHDKDSPSSEKYSYVTSM